MHNYQTLPLIPVLLVLGACRNDGAVVRATDAQAPRPPIASLSDFDRLAAARAAPFDGLSPEAIADIRAGLVFDELGVERYNFGAIQKHMTMAQYDALLSLFDAPDDPNAPPCPVRGYEPFVTSDVNTVDHAPIRTLADFDRVVMRGDTPLSRLSPVALRRLRDSLTITDLGIAGFKYLEAENELSPEDFDELMSLLVFDPENPFPLPEASVIDPETQLPPTGVPDMYCEARGTCAEKLRRLCNLTTC